MTKGGLLAAASLVLTLLSGLAFAEPVNIVAAENFYGDVATQIGGVHVAVTSILATPDDDTHLFEASVSIARALVTAKIVIVNGVDYDPWMEKLLAANKAPGRREILVATLAHKTRGDNPRLWYSPATMKALAGALSVGLAVIDPTHRDDYQRSEAVFGASLESLDTKIAQMRQKYVGQPVAASEAVSSYLAELLGLKVPNEEFALEVMSNAEPSASNIAAFENDLKDHKVKVMLYNAQGRVPAVQRLVQIAKDENIPVVGISETEPPGATYQQWMARQLEELDKALAGEAP
jgi:zinc/manganese transport system substrate-binding protein